MYTKKMKYVVKSCSLANPQDLQDLLNDMSEEGWELYSMQEDEDEEGNLYCHCVFMRQAQNVSEGADTINISSFKSRMEKMLSPEQSPYDICVDIQSKIREQKNKISKIKKELEGEAPASVSRKKLNDKISAGLKELDDLKLKLSHATSPDSMFSRLKEDKLSIHLSEELLSYIDDNSTNLEDELVAQTVKTRIKLVDSLGFIIPKIVFQDDALLNPYEFSIQIRGLDVYRALVYPNFLMFFEDELHLDKKIKNSVKDIDKITGKNVIWIERDKAKDFWCKGLSGSEVITRALEYFVIKHADDLLDYEELDKYIDVVNEHNEFLIENLIPNPLSMSDVKSILANLVKERVSIKNITYIFEKLNDIAGSDADRTEIIDNLRMSLSRQICNNYKNENGAIEAFELSEDTIVKFGFLFSIDENMTDECFDESSIFDFENLEKFVTKLKKQSKKYGIERPILVVPIEIRTIISSLLNKYIDVTVLAKEEIQYNAKLDVISKI